MSSRLVLLEGRAVHLGDGAVGRQEHGDGDPDGDELADDALVGVVSQVVGDAGPCHLLGPLRLKSVESPTNTTRPPASWCTASRSGISVTHGNAPRRPEVHDRGFRTPTKWWSGRERLELGRERLASRSGRHRRHRRCRPQRRGQHQARREEPDTTEHIETSGRPSSPMTRRSARATGDRGGSRRFRARTSPRTVARPAVPHAVRSGPRGRPARGANAGPERLVPARRAGYAVRTRSRRWSGMGISGI